MTTGGGLHKLDDKPLFADGEGASKPRKVTRYGVDGTTLFLMHLLTSEPQTIVAPHHTPV